MRVPWSLTAITFGQDRQNSDFIFVTYVTSICYLSNFLLLQLNVIHICYLRDVLLLLVDVIHVCYLRGLATAGKGDEYLLLT